jgi:hypothetical protein
MQYLFLIYADRSSLQMIPGSEGEVFDRACLDNYKALQENGYLLAAARLPGGSPANTVRVQNGNLSLTDGSFSETTAQLTALFFINARDLNEAVRVAANMPQARRGPIEVRSIEDIIWSG